MTKHRKTKFKFVTENRYDEKAKNYFPAHVLRCSECKTDAILRVSGRQGGIPDSVVEKKFTQQGWQVGKNRHNDICPSCIAHRKADKLMAKKSTVEENVVPIGHGREPTREEKRQIMDALETHYDYESPAPGYRATRMTSGLPKVYICRGYGWETYARNSTATAMQITMWRLAKDLSG